MPELTESERQQIADILDRRANDIATFHSEIERTTQTKLNGFPGSVEMALTREMKRLRTLADKLRPKNTEEEG